MRSLREKLKAVAAKPVVPSSVPPSARPDSFFCRQSTFPLHTLCGIESTTLDEIRACDPAFSGNHWNVQRLLFLDTETTGLSGGAGTIAFEIGVGFIENNQMVIRQYVMRDYSEEAAMLAEIARLFDRFDTLITFNGKSFDIPLLESRMIMHRIRRPLSTYPHFDLLHACRRVYKLRLRRCSLSALEAAVLGQTRTDDLPGAQVPERYFTYIKTREFALLEDVLRHNLQDVASLAALTGHLCAVFKHPEYLSHPEDLLSVGKTLERGGRIPQARRCYKILGHSTLSAQAHMRLSDSYKKEKAWADAVDTWQTMIAKGEGGIYPYVELAKYFEHAERDIPRALSYAKSALTHALNASLLTPLENEQLAALHKRIDRLNKKQRHNLLSSDRRSTP